MKEFDLLKSDGTLAGKVSLTDEMANFIGKYHPVITMELNLSFNRNTPEEIRSFSIVFPPSIPT